MDFIIRPRSPWTRIVICAATISAAGATAAAAAESAPSSPSTQPVHIAQVENVATILMPHRWGVDFVKRGPFLFMTGSESQRQFAVIDVHDAARMRVVAETQSGMYASRNLLVHGDLALVNAYRWINAMDIRDPLHPEMLPGCRLELDPGPAITPFYRFAWVGRHLFVACGNPAMALRVFRIDRTFLPTQIATVDLTPRLDAACIGLMTRPDNWYPSAEMIVDGTTLHTSWGTHIAGFDIHDPHRPTLLYCDRMTSNVVGLALQDKTLYVAMNGRVGAADPARGAAVVAVDLRAPHQPRDIGRYVGMDVPERLWVDAGHLYVVGEERTPESAMHLNTVPFTAGLRDQFRRRMALHVLNIEHPARPERTGQLAFPFHVPYYGDAVCRAMSLDAGVLFLADHDYGIRSVDVHDPEHPRPLGSLRTVSHEVRAVIPAGGSLYVVNGTSIHAADLTDPSHPTLDQEGCLSDISHWTVSTPAFLPGERYLCSITHNGRDIAICDFGQPGGSRGSVIRLIPVPRGWLARELGVANGLIYVLIAREDRPALASLAVYEPTDSGRLLRLLRIQSTAQFGSTVGLVWGTTLLVTPRKAFILHVNRPESRGIVARPASTSLDLVPIDLSTPDHPRVEPPIDLLRITPDLRPAYCHGRAMTYIDGRLYLYTIDESAQPPTAWLLVYDLRNPAAPRLAARVQDPLNPLDVWTVQNAVAMPPYPFVACTSEGRGLWIVDIRDPDMPVTAWREEPQNRASDLPGYDMAAKAAPAWRAPWLFVPTLDRVNLMRVRLAESPTPDAQAEKTLIRAALNAGSHAGPAERVVEFELGRNGFDAARRAVRDSRALTTACPECATCPRAASPISIDGKPDEWTHVPETRFERGPATVRWQWDESHLYLLIDVRDPTVNPAPITRWYPPCPVEDHVDIFLSGMPAVTERPYGPADTHVTIDLAGQVVAHRQNPRYSRGNRWDGVERLSRSRAAIATTPDGYTVEIALHCDDTWLPAAAGARVSCAIIVTDRGVAQMQLRHAHPIGYEAVQPAWPRIEMTP